MCFTGRKGSEKGSELRRGSKKGRSRRHLEGRNTPFQERDPLHILRMRSLHVRLSLLIGGPGVSARKRLSQEFVFPRFGRSSGELLGVNSYFLLKTFCCMDRRDKRNHDSQRHDRILRFFSAWQIGQFSPYFGAISFLYCTGKKTRRNRKKMDQKTPVETAPLSWSNVS